MINYDNRNAAFSQENESVQSAQRQASSNARDRESLMREVQAASFAAYDLQLYLNTHPTDSRAMMMYTAAVQRMNALTEEYEMLYGPLTAASAAGRSSWQWIKSPWTWE